MPVTTNEGNAGERPSTYGVAGLPALTPQQGSDYIEHLSEVDEGVRRGLSALVLSLQPRGGKLPPVPCERGLRVGGEAEGGPYLDTTLATSRQGGPQTWTGTTLDGEELSRERARNKTLLSLYHSLWAVGRDSEAKGLMGCGRYFQTLHFPCGTVKLIPLRCNSLFCPECSARRAHPLQKQVWERINKKEHDYFLLTVTVKDTDTLTRKQLDRLKKDFAKLRRSPLWKAEVSGGMYSVEATYTKNNKWHPHLHCLIETGKRLRMDWTSELKKLWLKITGDSKVLNLEPLYSITKKGRKTKNFNRRAIRELVKYATKAASFASEPERVDEFLCAFEDVRRVQSFGSFKGVLVKAEAAAKDPWENKFELAGCNCGMCTWALGNPGARVHISQTVLFPDGTRQLRLFDTSSDPPEVKADERGKPDSVSAYGGAHLFAPQGEFGFGLAARAA